MALVLENVTDEIVAAVQQQLEADPEGSPLLAVYLAARDALRPEDVPVTRLVFTGDFVSSVGQRASNGTAEFTLERGSGLVAAKTMPPDAEGVVDILVPLYLVLTDLSTGEGLPLGLVRHVAAHEAVHATIHHLGSEPFDVYRREDLPHAALQFAAMAGEQVEEHLAEYLAGLVVPPDGSTVGDLDAAIAAWKETMEVSLPALDPGEPDYFDNGMRVTFEALHILWKVLAYLAAELRSGDSFAPPPADMANSDGWKEYVGPWWAEYVRLLGLIPMSTAVDVPSTDLVVKQLATHLQAWAYDLGFDFHDTPQGGWFRIMIWD